MDDCAVTRVASIRATAGSDPAATWSQVRMTRTITVAYSDSHPSGAQLLLIACAAMADLALPA